MTTPLICIPNTVMQLKSPDSLGSYLPAVTSITEFKTGDDIGERVCFVSDLFPRDGPTRDCLIARAREEAAADLERETIDAARADALTSGKHR